MKKHKTHRETHQCHMCHLWLQMVLHNVFFFCVRFCFKNRKHVVEQSMTGTKQNKLMNFVARGGTCRKCLIEYLFHGTCWVGMHDNSGA